MTKLHKSITEPIVNFVKRIGSTISGAWEYAKNTNVSDIVPVKPIADIMNKDIVDIGKDIGHTISEKFSYLNTDITDIGKSLSASWTELINNIKPNKSLKDKSVAELKDLWINLNNTECVQQAKSLKEVA